VSNLDDLGGYKEIIINLLLENKDVIDLMLPNPVDGYDIDTQLLGSDTVKDSSGNLIFPGQIFPYFYTDGTNEKARTFVLIEDKISIGKMPTLFKTVTFYVYVFTHKSLLKMSGKEKAKFKQKGYKGSNRTDILSSAIDKTLNKNQIFGIKELQLNGVDIYKPSSNNDYYGRVLIYNAITENIGGDLCG
jgi:hypothetical protein